MKTQKRFLLQFLPLVLLSHPLIPSSAQEVIRGFDEVSKTTQGGLQKVTFNTPNGRVIVNLPDEMMAGDTISGTVMAEPKGQTEEERSKNMSALNGYVIQLATPKKSDGTTDFQFKAQVSTATSPFTFTLPPSSTLAPTFRNVINANSSGLGITLTNASGSLSPGGTTTIPIELVSLSLQSVVPLNTFQLPTIGQQGRTVVILGPFDGNAQNTTLNFSTLRSQVQDFEKNTENVSGGFGLIAESPRKAVFECPTNVTGPIEIALNEGNTQTKASYRNVGVNLSAPKTSLLKGERTTLTVQVTGLQGIKQPVPLTLDSKGVITMEGGPYQPLVIQPSQVGADGRYATTRGITGVQTGVWGATATVVTHPFDVCLQDDSVPARVVLWNTFTGDYIFSRPGCLPPKGQQGKTGGTTQPGGTTTTAGAAGTQGSVGSSNSLSGTGTVTRKGCIITLQHNAPDRRVFGQLDPCTNSGTTTIETPPTKMKFTITDRNTTDNTCTCGPGCK